jgi:hypothetical protein
MLCQRGLKAYAMLKDNPKKNCELGEKSQTLLLL